MAKARAHAVEHPSAGVTRAMDSAGDVVKATGKAASRAVYGACYYTSFGVSYVVLGVFSLVLIGNNPIGCGIRDGAVAAGKVAYTKRPRG